MVTRFAVPLLFGPLASSGAAPLLVLLSPPPLPAESWAAISPVLPPHSPASWGRLRERAKSYAKALANDILR
ncbi:hypothetical protein EGY27_19260 [Pseudomonas aeruginosa]|nr:hypothetical protein EGY27_19260 [Pseudomonas aeruginosa]